MNTKHQYFRGEGSSFADSGQEHEVKYYVKNFDHEFPDRNPQELEAACLQAVNELGAEEGKRKLEARARQILTS